MLTSTGITGVTLCAQALLLILFSSRESYAQINIVTANGGNDRTNANLSESQLSPVTVDPNTFGKLGTYSVDGQVYTQPLYAPAISIPGRGSVNLLVISTMHNSVYAFDADSTQPGSLVWHASLGPSVPAAILFGPNGDVGVEVGILGTGVIDLARGIIYVVTQTLLNGAPAFHLHALDLATGAERMNGPVRVTASVSGTGAGATPQGTLAFDAAQHLQRPALLLANNSIYLAFGSHGDQAPWHGWLISYDAADITRQSGAYVSTPAGLGGAFWQSGRGLAADPQGTLYATTGNGDYDGAQNFGQSFLKLAGAAPARTGSWTASDWKDLSDNDFDLSAGPALVPGSHVLIGADKTGTMYLIDGDTMGQPASGITFPAAQSSIFNLAVWGRGDGTYVYVQGSGEAVTSYRVTGLSVDPVPVSIGSVPIRYARIGMTLSANGSDPASGILWETSGNYNDSSAPGTLHAFDASDLTNELWNSDMDGAHDAMGPVAKFVGPTVANGRVYLPTFANAVIVYGLFADSGAAAPSIASLGNGASYASDAFSPGELIAIFGSGLGPQSPVGPQLDASGLVSTNLAGVRVLFDGMPGPMAYAGAAQVNAIVPFTIAPGATQVQVEYRGQTSDPVEIPVAASSPGLFSADASGAGPGLIVNPDGAINSPARPAAPGSVVVLYATGAGALSPDGQDGAIVAADLLPRAALPVTATVGGLAAAVLYAGGAPGMVEGILQVNLQIPDAAPPGPSLAVVLRIGDASSQAGITVAVGAR